MKHIRSLLMLAAFLTFTACQPTLGPDSGLTGGSLSGAWPSESGIYYYLDADGRLGIPGQAGNVGLSWKQAGNTLTLITAPQSPNIGGEGQAVEYRVLSLAGNRMRLTDDVGQM